MKMYIKNNYVLVFCLLLFTVISCDSSKNIVEVSNDHDYLLSNGWYGGGFGKPRLTDDFWSAHWHAGHLVKKEKIKDNSYIVHYNYAVKWNEKDTFNIYLGIENIHNSFIERKIQTKNNLGEIVIRQDKGKLRLYDTKLIVHKGASYLIHKFTFDIEEGCWTFFVSMNYGLLKQYGPGYHESFEIDHFPDHKYGSKEQKLLIEAIKLDSSFHTRCDEGVLW